MLPMPVPAGCSRACMLSAEGWAAAGFHNLGSLYDRVLEVALHGAGIERSAAIYALGFYDREVPEAALRQLLAAEDLSTRFSALELATRKAPGRFAREALAVARAIVARAEAAPAGGGQSEVAHLPRLLCRLARGPLPAPLLEALDDADPLLRRSVVQALQLGGNPQAVRHLERLRGDPDPPTRAAVQAALVALGPGE